MNRIVGVLLQTALLPLPRAVSCVPSSSSSSLLGLCSRPNSSLTQQPSQSKSTVPTEEDGKLEKERTEKGILTEKCGVDEGDEEEGDEMEEMFIMGPTGIEWGGPTRGGQRPEPTRFGDWERKGRASDF